jgi:hypothetical protein
MQHHPPTHPGGINPEHSPNEEYGKKAVWRQRSQEKAQGSENSCWPVILQAGGEGVDEFTSNQEEETDPEEEETDSEEEEEDKKEMRKNKDMADNLISARRDDKLPDLCPLSKNLTAYVVAVYKGEWYLFEICKDQSQVATCYTGSATCPSGGVTALLRGQRRKFTLLLMTTSSLSLSCLSH